MVGELERLMRLINDLLDMEKMQAGKFEMFPVRTKLADLVEASITAVRHIADSRTIRLVNETADGECLTDGARTIRVLVNLLSNALKSSSRGSQIVAGSSVLDDGKIVIAVKDWPANQRDVIFERFTQVYSSDSRDKGGSGLGLHICKTIIQQQGGSIWVEPNPEGGSIFLFSLEVCK